METGPVIDLGLMGGMFDPVHYGHLQAARNALLTLGLDKVCLLPCGTPVHRDTLVAPAHHRLAMLDLALADEALICVDDRECRSAEPSYTINSLRGIREENPQCRLFYIMGQDAFNSLPGWREWRQILDLVHVVVVARPGYRVDFSADLAQEFDRRSVASASELKQDVSGRILLARHELLDISSSAIREKIARRESVDELLPPAVTAYIQANGLYSTEY